MIYSSAFQRKFKCLLFIGLVSFLNAIPGSAQSKFAGKEDLLITPGQYIAVFNPVAPEIDGKINDAAWQNVA